MVVNKDTIPKKQKRDLINRLSEEGADDIAVEGADKRRTAGREGSANQPRKPDILDGDAQGATDESKKKTVMIIGLLFVCVVAAVSVFLRNDAGSSTDGGAHAYVGTLAPSVPTWETDLSFSQPTSRCLKDETYEVPIIDAGEYYAVFVDTGQIVYEKNGRDTVAFASIVKLLSALVVVDTFNLDAEISLLEEVNSEGNGLGLDVGDVATVRDLLGAALVGSKNDAMFALAQNYPGGLEAFVSEMENKAAEIGMTGTSISNPVGYDAPNQYATLEDIVLLMTVAVRDPVISEIISQERWEFKTESGFEETVETTNLLLGSVPGVVAGKTGFTGEAGWSLVEYVEGDYDFVTVVLGADDRYEATRQLIEAVREGYICD